MWFWIFLALQEHENRKIHLERFMQQFLIHVLEPEFNMPCRISFVNYLSSIMAYEIVALFVFLIVFFRLWIFLVDGFAIAGYLHIIEQMKELIKRAGKKSYTLVMGRPNPAKLANFPEVIPGYKFTANFIPIPIVFSYLRQIFFFFATVWCFCLCILCPNCTSWQ